MNAKRDFIKGCKNQVIDQVIMEYSKSQLPSHLFVIPVSYKLHHPMQSYFGNDIWSPILVFFLVSKAGHVLTELWKPTGGVEPYLSFPSLCSCGIGIGGIDIISRLRLLSLSRVRKLDTCKCKSVRNNWWRSLINTQFRLMTWRWIAKLL